MLTAKQRLFVDEYLVDRNAAAAYRREGYKATGNSAETAACRLLRDPQVQELIGEREGALRERLEIKQEDVVRLLWSIAQADANDVVQHRRVCCTHCYGKGFKYQRTVREYERDYALFMAEQSNAEEDAPAAVFAELGGTGFNKTLMPHPDCPECNGEGVSDVYIADTRELPPAARALYAGTKVTQHGIEVKLHSTVDAAIKVGEHLGMFRKVHDVNHKGAVGVLDVEKSARPICASAWPRRCCAKSGMSSTASDSTAAMLTARAGSPGPGAVTPRYQ
ncbi:terminase small subunit (plasmid) [Ralstonia sp. 25C]|uniref:terminase small subunit n=1 Tax=Ralstonia sp. 25C TaxID=3447363 RepID=UPI003F751A29